MRNILPLNEKDKPVTAFLASTDVDWVKIGGLLDYGYSPPQIATILNLTHKEVYRIIKEKEFNELMEGKL